MKRTKGARFNAAERLEKEDRRRSNYIAIASCAVIALTIFPVFHQPPEIVSSLIGFSTVVFSVGILAVSLLQYSFSSAVKAEQLHRCGLEINTIRKRLQFDHELDHPKLSEYSHQFDEVINRYPTNHSEADMLRYKSEHADEFETTLSEAEISRERENKRQREARATASVAIATITALLLGLSVLEPLASLIRVALNQ